MGRKKPSARGGDEENPPVASQGGPKSKKKAMKIDDDEYAIGADISHEPEVEEEKVVITGKKKGKKGKKGGGSVFSASAFDLLGEEGNDDNEDDEKSGTSGEKDEEEDEPVVSFTGKKKSKSKKGGGMITSAGFAALDDDNDDDVDNSLGDAKSDNEEDDEDDEPVIAFTGKKKPSKNGKNNDNVFAAANFDDLDENENEDDDAPITFSGKKKKSSKASKKTGNSFSAALLGEDNDGDDISEPTGASEDAGEDEDSSMIVFSGKKKSSKKKGGSAFATLSGSSVHEDVTDGAEQEQSLGTITSQDTDSKAGKAEVVETSKNKKKKKGKSGRTAKEEEDLDELLKELNGGSSEVKSTVPPEVKIPVSSEPVAPAIEKEGEEEVESAAAKKKKKKKEKEKEKKAAAAAASASAAEAKEEETKNETIELKKTGAKSKAADKKLPKHVREMQEALARRQEAEERMKREEEEKLRKEEEERIRLEEIEKLAEEAKRRKKEREKEKLLKKKLEGKLLTGKQKEEARRREAMRNQILANAGGLPILDKESAPTKRPKYQSKKTKPAHNQTNGAASVKVDGTIEAKELPETVSELDSKETETVNKESVIVEEKPNPPKKKEIEEEDDDDEWDAKSWDDVDIKIKGAFDDEEVDSEHEAVVENEIIIDPPTSNDTVKSLEVENKKSVTEAEATVTVAASTSKSKKKDASGKGKTSAAGAPKQGEEDLRSPICCIMGHVDTGKTKLLDCIRGTNVQEGEAGGITQQIGATYFPAENIRERTRELKADAKLKVPGLLVIDTPGHESFTNLRSRGSSLCDIAILVVDIMHGLEPQTIESLNLLKMRNAEFIVALNKVDRLYGWKSCPNAPIMKAMKQQTRDVTNEFNMRLTGVITQFKEQGLNTELYYKNKEMGETFSIVPTSAISGEGIPDLLLLLVQWTQKTMVEKLTFSNNVQCTVLEVKVIEGHGTTIDVVLVNGVLHEGDQIVVCGLQGPIVTSIRALLTPHPMKELRVKGTYIHHKEIKAAQGIKITAQGLEHAIAGTGLYVVGPDDDLEDVKEATMDDMKTVMNRIDKTGEGVCVQASTLGSLEALLEFLKSPDVKIPVSGISIGPVHKKDVMKASVMLERKKEFATILAFDVKVTQEARELADEAGVKIFMADIIYHLFDQFKAYIDNLKEEKKKEAADEAVFPCVLKILPNCIFNKKDPIVLGVDILEGIAKVGAPICIPQKEFIDIGRIASIENNHKPVDTAKKGQKVAIKIVGTNPEEQQKMFGRHFEIEDELVSHITRKSIDILKANYRDELSIEEWKLVVKLKNLFGIQ